MNLTSQRWNIVEHDRWEEALMGANSDASATMATVQNVILYTQAERDFVVTSFPLAFVASRVKIDDLKKGGDPDQHYNRPLIPGHYKSIANYLVNAENGYILPPLTLCVEEELTVHVVRSASTVRSGIIVLPHTLRFIVTDGQHRIKGIEEAMKLKPSLGRDAIGVTIVNEPDIEKVHQDFVDCAQTKAIPPALLATFNVRDPIARLVKTVVERVVVFKDRIEKVGNTVGKNSIKIFTMNQLRAGVAELLTGDSTRDRQTLTRHAEERLPNEAATKYHETQISEFYRKFAAHNDEWTGLVLAAEEAAHDKVDTWALRDKYVHFTATGLLILGRVGHYILQKEDPLRGELIEKLAKLDWSRAGEIWTRCNVVTNEGKVMTSSVGIRKAVMAVKEQIGLELTPAELKKREEEAAAQLILESDEDQATEGAERTADFAGASV